MLRKALNSLTLAFLLALGGGCGSSDPRPTGTFVLASSPLTTSNCSTDFQNWLLQYAGAIRPGSLIELERVGKNSIDVSFEAGVSVLVSSTNPREGFYSGTLMESFEVEGCLVSEDLNINAIDRSDIFEIYVRESWVIEPVEFECIWDFGNCRNSYEFFANQL